MFDCVIKMPGNVSPKEFIVCLIASLILGFVISFIHMFKNEYTKGFAIALVILPMLVQTIIMLVNGSIGTGIAVMGAFSLVRFRSAQGNAREISSIFMATATGLATAMGYIWIGVAIVAVAGLVIILLTLLPYGDRIGASRELKITIPDDLDFEGIFDDLFEKYTQKCELIRCKTTNMGSLYELTYLVTMKKGVGDKLFLDEIRCRNGNLTVICGRPKTGKDEL